MIKKYLRILSLTFTCYCLCVTTASARVCFLPDSDDCGQGEITSMTVTCESQGGYNTEDLCSSGKKTSQICYPNNDCYYRKCQYDSKADCEKHVNINRYKCLSETVDDTTCYYAVAKSCSEIDSEYKSSYNPETEAVDDTIIDANGNKCYKTHKKRCWEINTRYQVACSSLGGQDTGRTGSDGACLICYTCADKGYNEIGLKNLNCWDCEKCPIGLTFKCSVKKDLATSEYKIVSSIGSRPDPNAQICLKKNCADKFLKTEQKCASKNLAFIPSKPAVRASDGVCGTCTLKTCKQQDLVAKTDCDTKTNTFTENKSVTASDAPCGTCVKKEVKTCEQIGKENNKNYIDNSGSCAMGTKTIVEGVKDTNNNQCYYCKWSCSDYNNGNVISITRYIDANDTCNKIKQIAEGKYDSEGNQCYICGPGLIPNPGPDTGPVTITITYYEQNSFSYNDISLSGCTGSDSYKVKFDVSASDGKPHTVKFKFDNFCQTCTNPNLKVDNYPLEISENSSIYTLYGSKCCYTKGTATGGFDYSALKCDRSKVNHAETLSIIVDGVTFMEQDQGSSRNTSLINGRISLLDDIQKTATIGNKTVKLVKGSSSTGTTIQCSFSTKTEAASNCKCPTPRVMTISENCYECAEPLPGWDPCSLGDGSGAILKP